jgi:valyl-tRNA synthetase
MLFSSPAGNDLPFDEKLVEQGRNFSNKIWNAYRLVSGWEIDSNLSGESNQAAITWFENRFNEALTEIEDHFGKFRISDALMATYKLVWDDFCSWYLEMIKPAYQAPIDAATQKKTIEFFEDILKILHPFMPFLTEELWQQLDSRPEGSSICVAHWPQSGPINEQLIGRFNHTQALISALRTLRKEKQLKPKEILEIQTQNTDQLLVIPEVLSKLGFTSSIAIIESAGANTLSIRVETTEYYVPFGAQINVEEEVEKLQKELAYQKGFLEIVNRKLTNKRFVDGAPDEVVAGERKKASDAQEKIQAIEITLSKLG